MIKTFNQTFRNAAMYSTSNSYYLNSLNVFLSYQPINANIQLTIFSDSFG